MRLLPALALEIQFRFNRQMVQVVFLVMQNDKLSLGERP
jgi:hypothetical protein